MKHIISSIAILALAPQLVSANGPLINPYDYRNFQNIKELKEFIRKQPKSNLEVTRARQHMDFLDEFGGKGRTIIDKKAKGEIAKKAAKAGLRQGARTLGTTLMRPVVALPLVVGDAVVTGLEVCPMHKQRYSILESQLIDLETKLGNIQADSRCPQGWEIGNFQDAPGWKNIDVRDQRVRNEMIKCNQRKNLIEQIDHIRGTMSDIKGFYNQWCKGSFGDL